MAFSRLASSAASAPPVGSLGRLEELRGLAAELRQVVAVTDDLRAALVSKVGVGLVGARAVLALSAPTVGLLRG